MKRMSTTLFLCAVVSGAPLFKSIDNNCPKGVDVKKGMKKIIQTIIAVLVLGFVMSSCKALEKSLVIPTAMSSVSKVVVLKDLNMERNDYQIINTETAEAVVYYENYKSGKKFEISESNGEYSLEFTENKVGNYDIRYSGIVKYGCLSADDKGIDYAHPRVADFARGLAAYRLINSVQDQGADGIIEPIISVKVGQDGRRVVFTATISAKLIKIKTK